MSTPTPRMPAKPTVNNPGDVWIDESNPYNDVDRGLFACIQLQIDGSTFEDRLCRIASLSVEAYQGDLPVSIFTYQLVHFSKQPTNEQECIDFGQIYVDPRNGNSSFSFATAAKDYSPLMAEALCIRDFITYKRAQEPVEFEDVEKRRRVFNFHAPMITAHSDLLMGVSHVQHKQYFTSTNNLPLELERTVIRYRGFELIDINPAVAKENWKAWGANQYIEFESKMGSTRVMVQRALEHFIKTGHDQVKHLFQEG